VKILNAAFTYRWTCIWILVTYRREIDGRTFVISLATELNTFKGLRCMENMSTVLETDGRLLITEEVSSTVVGTWPMPRRPLVALVILLFTTLGSRCSA
jgi:hypothetical protein